MQRALERRVRKYKRRYLAETAAGVDASQSAAKLKAARQQLNDFLSETGERVDGARTEVPGFGQREAKQEDAARNVAALNESLHMEPQPVTMESISSVKSFSCDTLNAMGQKRLQNAHKRLLIAASKQPLGVEVGKVFDLNMTPLTKDIVGGSEGHSVRLPDFDTPHIVIHTHPASGIFSHGDLSSFTQNENLQLMTAIGHDGHIYAVEKSSNYDFIAAKSIVWQLNAEIDRLKEIPRAELPDEQFLEQAEKLVRNAIGELQEKGVNFYE